jgi:hypothetical protein
VLNFSFIPKFLEKCIQNAFVNFGSRSDTMTLDNPWCLHQPLRIGYAVSNAVAVPTIGTTCANLANRTTITKMASHSCDSGKFVMKSMHILCHGLGGIGPGRKRPPCFFVRGLVHSASIQALTKWITISFMHSQWYLLDTILW